MSLKEALSEIFGWGSPIGVCIFLTGLGMFFYLGMLALQILVTLIFL